MSIEVDLGCEVVSMTQFTELTDTPNSYSGQAGKLATVNGTEDGLEFSDAPTSGVSTVTGDGVGGTATDVVMSYPTPADIGLTQNTPEYYNLGEDYLDINAACEYCETTGEDLVLQKDKVYTFTREVNTYSTFNIKGNGATFKRADALTTTLSVQANKGETVITVADASSFSVGMKVILLEGTDKQYTHSSEKVNITAINGNDITLQNPLDNYSSGYNINTYPVGSILLNTYSVINSLPVVNEASSTIIENLTFDGNRVNNDFIYTWNVNSHVSFTSDNTILRNCSIINMQTEFGYINNGRVENCYAKDNNGSAIHFGANATNPARHFGIVDNCYFEDCCEVSLINNGHNEGVITWSGAVVDVEIRNTKVINSTEGFIGDIRGDDGTLKVYNCEASNCLLIGVFDNWGATEIKKDVIFSGCVFDTCNDLELRQSDVGNTFGYNNFLFESCRFLSSGINFENSTNFSFDSCIFDSASILMDECEFINFNSCHFISCANMKPSVTKTFPEVYRNVIFNDCVLDTCNMRSDNMDRLIIQGCTIYDSNFYFLNTSINFENNIVEQRSGFNYYGGVQTGSTTGGYITLISCHKVNIINNKVTQKNLGHFESAFITGGGAQPVTEANFRDNYIVGWSYGIRYDDNFAESTVKCISYIEDNYILLNKSTAQASNYGYCCQCNSFTIIKNNELFAESNSEGVIRMKSNINNTRNTSQIIGNTMFIEDNSGAVLSTYTGWSGVIINNVYNGTIITDEDTNPSGNEFRIFERNTRANYIITLPEY